LTNAAIVKVYLNIELTLVNGSLSC